MHHKRFECLLGTFNQKLVALNHIQHIHTTTCMMQHLAGKPMAAGFYKFILMQTGTLFSPSLSAGNRLHPVYKLPTGKSGSTFPLYYILSMFDVDRTGKPSSSSLPQSHNLKVNKLGVALISSTIAPAPEQ